MCVMGTGAAAVFIHSLGQIPHLTAKLHIIELPFYLVLPWQMISFDGVIGAVIAWTARIAADTIVMFGMGQWLLWSESE